MASVVITGFRNIEEAREFCNWYSGQGEQDSSIWFECRQDEGMDIRSFVGVRSIEQKDDTTMLMSVAERL